MRSWTRPFWIFLAAVFLFEAWVWDLCISVGRWVTIRIPLEPCKKWLRRIVDRLPAPAVLAIFLIPLAILEPLKLAALWLIATHHWFWGVAIFVIAKFVGFGLIAFLFDLTRDKLLSMAWMAKLYDRTLRALQWAHGLVEPYKDAVRRQMAATRQWFAELLHREAAHNGIVARALRLRARLRRQT